MKFTNVALGAALSASALAFPGMKGEGMMDFHKQLVRKAQAGPTFNRRDSPQLTGASNSTNVGAAKMINDCLGGASCEAAPQKVHC